MNYLTDEQKALLVEVAAIKNFKPDMMVDTIERAAFLKVVSSADLLETHRALCEERGCPMEPAGSTAADKSLNP